MNMRNPRLEKHDIHGPWGENNRQPETKQEDLNTQKSNEESGNTWETQLTQINMMAQGKQN